MQVSNISATNFGILIKESIKVRENVKILPKDCQRILQIAKTLNNNVARGINVYAEIAQPSETCGSKSIRIITCPTQKDMACIHSFRPEAVIYQYKRRSKWVDLYSSRLIDDFSDFIRRQKGFIHHCTVDKNHRAEPFGNPTWRPNGMQTPIALPKRITLQELLG